MIYYPTKKLGKVTILNPKKSEIKDIPNDLPVSFVPMPAVDDVSQEIIQLETRELGAVRKGYTYFEDDDVLFAKITPCMENGKVAIAKDLENGIGFGSTEFHVIRPTEDVTKEWIFHIVASQNFREEAKKHMHGVAGQKRVPIEFLENYEIPVPPIAEQRKIVEKIEKQLAKINEAERLRTESEQLAEKLVPAALHEIFSSHNWEEKTLGELIDIKHGFAFKSEYFNKTDGPILLTPGNFLETGGLYFTTKNTKHYNGVIPEGFILSEGDLVVVMTDLSSYCKILGNPAFLNNHALHNQRIGKVILKSKELLSQFLFYYFLSEPYKQHIKATSTGTMVKHTAPIRILQSKISLPPIDEQKKIVKKLDALAGKVKVLRELQAAQAADLKALKQSILHQAFSGDGK